MPLRKQVDPVELQQHLGSLVRIECLPDLSDFGYRLIATNVAAAGPCGNSTPRTDAEYRDFRLSTYHDVATCKIIGAPEGRSGR